MTHCTCLSGSQLDAAAINLEVELCFGHLRTRRKALDETTEAKLESEII